jgi:hypothetical protein
MYELILWARVEAENISGNIDQYGIKYGSKSHKIFLDAFKNAPYFTVPAFCADWLKLPKPSI